MEGLYTVRDVSKLFKCNTDFVYALIDMGVIEPLKLGSYKFRKSEIDRFLDWCEGKDVGEMVKEWKASHPKKKGA